MSDELDPKTETPDPNATDDEQSHRAPGEDDSTEGEDTAGDGTDASLEAETTEQPSTLEEEVARLREENLRLRERGAGPMPATERALEAQQERLDQEAEDLARLRKAAKDPRDSYAREQIRVREELLELKQQTLNTQVLMRIPPERRSIVERLWDEVEAKGGDPRFPDIASLDRAVQWKQSQDEVKKLRVEIDMLRKGKKPAPANGKIPASRRPAADVAPTNGGAPPPTKGNTGPRIMRRADFQRKIAELEASPRKEDLQESIRMQLDLANGRIRYEEHVGR